MIHIVLILDVVVIKKGKKVVIVDLLIYLNEFFVSFSLREKLLRTGIDLCHY